MDRPEHISLSCKQIFEAILVKSGTLELFYGEHVHMSREDGDI